METAHIIAIDRHRLVDGKGITTLVLFQGCPLRCKYCLNPTTLAEKHTSADKLTVEQLYEQVKVDDLFFRATGGGITFGGGEPLLWSGFIREFADYMNNGWRITVETSLNVPRENLEKALPVVDEYIVDVKDMNEATYLAYTGKDNRQVIDNLRWLAKQGMADKVIVKVPFIPSFNSFEDTNAGASQLKEMGFTHFRWLTYVTDIEAEEAEDGKDLCKELKRMRLSIATANGLKYSPTPCDRPKSSNCAGTCPACDAETLCLQRELEEMQERGETVNLKGLLEDDLLVRVKSISHLNQIRREKGGRLQGKPVESKPLMKPLQGIQYPRKEPSFWKRLIEKLDNKIYTTDDF